MLAFLEHRVTHITNRTVHPHVSSHALLPEKDTVDVQRLTGFCQTANLCLHLLDKGALIDDEIYDDIDSQVVPPPLPVSR